MEILNYVLIATLVSTGLILGRVLANIAKEEIKPGKKYLIILQKLLFCSAIILLMYLNKTNVHYIWSGSIVIFSYLLFFNKICPGQVYVLFGVLFYLFTKTEYFLPASALLFLYGFPTGTLLKSKKILALSTVLFLASAISLFLILK